MSEQSHQNKTTPQQTKAPEHEAETASVAAPEDMQGDLNIVGKSFMWMYNYFDDQLRVLEQDVSKKGQPSWSEKLAETLLDVAIGKAASTLIGAVAGKVAAAFADDAGEEEEGVEASHTLERYWASSCSASIQ